MRTILITTLPLLFAAFISIDSKAQQIDSLAFVKGVTILFESAEDILTDDDKVQIDSLTNSQSPNTLYRIEGHTDDVGSLEYNNALALRRAKSVQSYLTETKLIDANNIFTDSYGELKPAESTLEIDNRKYNRRVDLSIYIESTMRKISGVVRLDSLDTITVAKVLVQGKDFIDSTFTNTDGSWSIFAPDSAFIKLDISAPNYFFTSKRIKVTQVLDKRVIELELPKLAIGKVYDMPDFYFKGDLPVLIPSSKPTLKLLLATMASSDVCIHIKGHVNRPNAPPVETTDRQYILSEERAKMVYNYLKNNGIDAHRIQYKGYGNWEMIYPKATSESAMQKNRRVEIEIVTCKK